MADMKNRVQEPLPSRYSPIGLRRREIEEDEDTVASASVMRVQKALATAESPLSRMNSSGYSGSLLGAAVLNFQGKIGNRAVDRLLYRTAEDEVEPSVEKAIDRKRGGGEGMSTNSRSEMETFFGADFSGVHLHNDTESDDLNKTLNARAFTVGKDIFFRQGEYNTLSSSGQELLAHELTHVVQQNGGLQTKLTLSEPESTLELEADRTAHLYGRFKSRGQSASRDEMEDEEDAG